MNEQVNQRESSFNGGIARHNSARRLLLAALLISSVALAGCTSSNATSSATDKAGDAKPAIHLLNVSYDPTREFYAEFNKEFAKHWQENEGQEVLVEQSHGPSGAQARSVIDGLKADVVTLALAYDIDQIAEIGKLLPPNWQERLPNNSTPYQSTVVFLVRKGNPKNIKDWNDLVRPEKEGDREESKVRTITANPKTSGAGRLAYMAAWGYALKQNGNDEAKAKEFINTLYSRVPVLDSGARGSTTTFVQRGIGDVLLAWENEALLAIKELGPDKVELVAPSISILAEPPVTVVDKNATANGTAEIAKAYLEFLYSPAGQKIAAKHYYRPSNSEGVDAETLKQFPQLTLFSVKDVFGTWKAANDKHFKDDGIFDSVYLNK